MVETNIFNEEELHHNCTVQILRNSQTGEQSIGWWETVRCRECEYLTPSVWQAGKGHCCRLGIYRDFDWFCADGRKADEDTMKGLPE